MSKTKRVGFKLDMTPMVDVGFLLLTFFMLTTQFKPPEVAEVIIPTSHSKFKLPDADVMTVTVDKEGNIYFMKMNCWHNLPTIFVSSLSRYGFLKKFKTLIALAPRM